MHSVVTTKVLGIQTFSAMFELCVSEAWDQMVVSSIEAGQSNSTALRVQTSESK